jgi:hypothetical protein
VLMVSIGGLLSIVHFPPVLYEVNRIPASLTVTTVFLYHSTEEIPRKGFGKL